jgi:aspartate-semialdehyde dehydrogenase
MHVAVLGATGVVGQEILSVLEQQIAEMLAGAGKSLTTSR